MKNIFFLILLLLLGGSTYAQSWNRITGKNQYTDSAAFLKPKNNFLEDSVLTLTYPSGVLKMKKVTNSFIIPPGVDSITLYNGELCEWMGGTPTCWFLTPGTGGSVDSFHLSPDSLAIYQYRNGAFIDSIYLLHTYLYVDNHFSLTPNYGGNPYAQLLNATRLIDTTYATPDSLYLITRYGDGDIDSTQWIGDGGSGGGGGGSGITALTGDVTASGTGSVGATLATVNSNVGSFRNANITVNAKGLITAASSSITRQVITSGSTATVTGGNYIVTIDPASTLAAMTLTLPASPLDLDIVQVDFGGTLTSGTIVTALAISPNSGQTILDNSPPLTATADNTLLYRYRTSNTKWYRFKP